MKDFYRPCVLFAVSDDLAPAMASETLLDAIQRFIKQPVKTLTGCDNNETETVYLTEISSQDVLNRVIFLAGQCSQDYVFLIRDNRECAKLMLDSGAVVPCGTLKGVSQAEAERNGTYTTDGVTYWVAKQDSDSYDYQM